MKSIKLQIFIFAAALIITGCSDNSPENISQIKGAYGVEVSAEIPAAKGVLMSDDAVAVVEVNAYNTSGLFVGGGSLTKNGTTSWRGTISISETGTIRFTARAYNSLWGNLYIESGTPTTVVTTGLSHIAITLAAVSSTPITDLTGTWDLELSFPWGKEPFYCILSQSGSVITQIFGGFNNTESLSFSVSGTEFSFTAHYFYDAVDDDEDDHFTIAGSGKLTGGESVESGIYTLTTYSIADTDHTMPSVLLSDLFTMKRISRSTAIPVYTVPTVAGITIDGNVTDWPMKTMITDPAGDASHTGADVEWVKTAVNSDGTRMSVLAKINGNVNPSIEYSIEFSDFSNFDKEVACNWKPAGKYFGLGTKMISRTGTATALLINTTYYFGVSVNGATAVQIPVAIHNSQVTYEELAAIIDTALTAAGASAVIPSNIAPPDIIIYSDLFDTAALITLSAGTTNDIFTALGLSVPAGTGTSSWTVSGHDYNLTSQINGLNGIAASSGEYIEFSFNVSPLGLPTQSLVGFKTLYGIWYTGLYSSDDDSDFFGYVSLP